MSDPGPSSNGPLDIKGLPSLGTPIQVYTMVGKTPKLLTTLPNREPGKAEAYLTTLSKRYIVGPCNRGVIQVRRRE